MILILHMKLTDSQISIECNTTGNNFCVIKIDDFAKRHIYNLYVHVAATKNVIVFLCFSSSLFSAFDWNMSIDPSERIIFDEIIGFNLINKLNKKIDFANYFVQCLFILSILRAFGRRG